MINNTQQEEKSMQSYQEMSREELLREKESLEQQYKEICKKGLKLDMSRG